MTQVLLGQPLIRRAPGTQRNDSSDDGRRIAVFFTEACATGMYDGPFPTGVRADPISLCRARSPRGLA